MESISVNVEHARKVTKDVQIQPHPKVVLISCHMRASSERAARLRRGGLSDLIVRPWGDQLGYEYIHRMSGTALAVLDAIPSEPVTVIAQRVRSLALLGPVSVLTAQQENTPLLLNAGAINVIPRNAETSEVAARITADFQWLRRMTGTPSPSRVEIGKGILRRHRVQSILLEILLTRNEPLCCHALRWLLGGVAAPMSLRALRARMQRLLPHLAEYGRTYHRAVNRGTDIFTVHKIQQSSTHPGDRAMQNPYPRGRYQLATSQVGKSSVSQR